MFGVRGEGKLLKEKKDILRMRFNEVSEAKRRKFGKIPARDFPDNRC